MKYNFNLLDFCVIFEFKKIHNMIKKRLRKRNHHRTHQNTKRKDLKDDFYEFKVDPH